MFERFTPGVRRVMSLANEEAKRFNHEYVGTEHILLGLVSLGDGQEVGLQVLTNLDVDLQRVRVEVEEMVKRGPNTSTTGNLPHTPRTKKVISFAVEEARSFNHKCVGTEHLLLGLLREQDGVAALVLMNLGLKLDDVREEVLNVMGASQTQQPEAITELDIDKRTLLKACQRIIESHRKTLMLLEMMVESLKK